MIAVSEPRTTSSSRYFLENHALSWHHCNETFVEESIRHSPARTNGAWCCTKRYAIGLRTQQTNLEARSIPPDFFALFGELSLERTQQLQVAHRRDPDSPPQELVELLADCFYRLVHNPAPIGCTRQVEFGRGGFERGATKGHCFINLDWNLPMTHPQVSTAAVGVHQLISVANNDSCQNV